MRIILLNILLTLLNLFPVFSQVAIDNAIFRKIKKESYQDALDYGHLKLSSLKEEEKILKKAIPYHLGLGMVYKKMGNFSEAEKHYTEASNILLKKQTRNIRLKLIDYDVLDELAALYLETGNFMEAEDMLKQSIQQRENRFGETNLLRYRSYLVYGNYFFRVKDYDSAYVYYKKYIFYLKNSRHTSKEELNRYADTYRYLTEMELQRKDFNQALYFARKNKHFQFHSWTKKEAGENTLNKIISLNLISRCYLLLGQTEKAEKFSKLSFSFYDKVISKETYDLVPLLMNRAHIYWSKGIYEEAEKDFIKASQLQSEFIEKNFKYLSEYEKENFYELIKENFQVLNSFALDKSSRNKNTESDTLWSVVYNFHIRTKGIILNESGKLMEQVQHSEDVELKKQYAEWRKLKNELSKKVIVEGLNENDPAIKKIKSSINHLEKEMSGKTALFSEPEKQVSWVDVRNKLKEGEAAIEVLRVEVYDSIRIDQTSTKIKKELSYRYKGLSDSIAYVFLTLKHNSSMPEVVVAREGNFMEGKFYKYYRNASTFKIEDDKSYDFYWKALESKIKNTHTIYLSSDGIYNLVNLWIIKNPATGKYLIDELSIVNLTNTRQLLAVEDRSTDIRSILLLGRPNYHGNDSLPSGDSEKGQHRGISSAFRDGIHDLPGTQEEILAIESNFKKKGINSKVLLWDNATEDLLKGSESYHVLHIATHGFFDAADKGRNPMLRSGLLLAGVSGMTQPGKEDGLLTAYEASNLNLKNTQIVVLSACETGLGEIKHGEGVYGLQRAFEVSGVNIIIMSMWKVNDQTTQELMVAFYEQLLKTGKVNESFKYAQLLIRKKYPERLYWGAFKLIGM